ncbi:MAG: hypothetical protein ACOY94_23910 [Bacillota bacterium]
MSLLVSLPANAPDLARAAVEAGADALKVHLNVAHRASGTHFGSLAEERDRLAEIRQIAGNLPLGLVAGGQLGVPAPEVVGAVALGFRTISMYAHHLPAAWLGLEGAEFMAAPDYTYTPEEIAALGRTPIALLEASVIHPEGYGQPLTVRDLAMYSLIAERVSQPVVVPSQRKILPEDVDALHRAGVRGVMIGAVVTGRTPESLYAATQAFRKAVNSR